MPAMRLFTHTYTNSSSSSLSSLSLTTPQIPFLPKHPIRSSNRQRFSQPVSQRNSRATSQPPIHTQPNHFPKHPAHLAAKNNSYPQIPVALQVYTSINFCRANSPCAYMTCKLRFIERCHAFHVCRHRYRRHGLVDAKSVRARANAMRWPRRCEVCYMSNTLCSLSVASVHMDALCGRLLGEWEAAQSV